VGVLGPTAIAAVGLTNQPKFIGLALFLSMNVAISAIVARRRGENDPARARQTLMQSLIIAVVMSIIIGLICVFFANPIIRFAGANDDTIGMASSYFSIIMGGLILNVICMTINAAQRGAGNTKIALRTNIVSNVINVIFNYLLIGGNLGFPRLGTDGAAIATVLGSAAACIMGIISVMDRDSFVSLRHIKRVRFDRETIFALLNIGSSTLVEQVFLRVGFLVYAIIIASLGTTAFAAHQIGMNILTISFAIGDGLSVAAVALVGHSLGQKRRDLAKIFVRVCQRIGIILSIALAVIFVLLAKQLYTMFTTDAKVLEYGVKIMEIMAVIVFMQITQVVYSGALRGAGDTKYTAFVSLISVAIIRPGMGFLFCYPLGLGLTGAWIGLAIDQFARFILTWMRFRGGTWLTHKI
ncbi:MAG: MATE family efflux transporter, partial [Clostridia bacterium]